MGIARMKLGSQGLEVSAQGLGCMGMSAFYGPPKPESDMIALIHHAIGEGITFLDTSDIYGPLTNEILIGKSLAGDGVRDKVQLATKFGIVPGSATRSIRGTPEYVRSACEASLKRLQVDCIDLYYQHRVDTSVPIEVTVGELKKLVEEGKIKYIGMSEASASTIRRAHAVHPITAVQLEWSLWSRDCEKEIIPTCRELGIGIVAYSPLGRGFLSSGPKIMETLSDGDFRKACQCASRFPMRHENNGSRGPLSSSLLQFFSSINGEEEEEEEELLRIEAKMGEVGRMKLGSQGLEVSAQGLGCMGMSAFYGPPKPEPDMIALIHHAIGKGVTFLDTSDVYGPHTNETLIGKSLAGGVREKVELATKFGFCFEGSNATVRGSPEYVRAACEGSLKRLQVDCIDLYYQHRVDTSVPIEVTVGELKKLVEEGKIKYIGLSEASASTIRRAHTVHPITAVQLEWSLWTRDVEEDIIPTCRELGIGIVAYSPLGRGFFSSGPKIVETLADGDLRKYLPRFQKDNLEHNKQIFEKVNEIATRKGCTPSQLALAWVHHQGNDVCPIPGTTKIKNLEQNIGALSVKLTPEEMSELEYLASEVAVKGDRYGATKFTWKDSETPPLSS